jgi:hypothetical protein
VPSIAESTSAPSNVDGAFTPRASKEVAKDAGWLNRSIFSQSLSNQMLSAAREQVELDMGGMKGGEKEGRGRKVSKQPLPAYVSSRPPSTRDSAMYFPPLEKQVRANDHIPCASPCPAPLYLFSLAVCTQARARSLSHDYTRSSRNFMEHTRLKTLATLARHQSGNCVVCGCLRVCLCAHAHAR